ncbi:hypothetical protein AB1L30_16590 [Bremerella sp. JC817]|uniref:hypothetical protein n=1 Tax=Bremerella sp. JC817 TaxID=3231756 RepID=UPI003457E718
MDKTERMLLENVLNALDRLFDHETQVCDLCDLLIATSAALSNSDHTAKLEEAASETDTLRRSSLSREKQRDQALVETDELRKYLSDVLYKDSPLKI